MAAVDEAERTDEEQETDEDQDAIDAMNHTASGKSIDDRAEGDTEGEGDAEEAEEPVPLEQQALPGLDTGLTLVVGGNRPNKSEVRFTAKSRPVDGQFKKGDRVRLLVEAQVSDLAFPDTHDGNGNVLATTRRHTLRAVSIQILDAPSDGDGE